jgi:hypothetical protein
MSVPTCCLSSEMTPTKKATAGHQAPDLRTMNNARAMQGNPHRLVSTTLRGLHVCILEGGLAGGAAEVAVRHSRQSVPPGQTPASGLASTLARSTASTALLQLAWRCGRNASCLAQALCSCWVFKSLVTARLAALLFNDGAAHNSVNAIPSPCAA